MGIGAWGLAAGLALAWTGGAAAESWQLAGHAVTLEDTGEGGARLVADGAVVLEDWQVFADGALQVPGGAVVWGAAGPGGNACNAAPFALWLPQGGPARLDGPADSCAYLVPAPGPDGISWTAEALPGEPSETWVWTAAGGLVAGQGAAFAPEAGLGWEALAGLDGQHPVEALKLSPVWAALQAGLAPADMQAFSERISELGSGGLTGADYLGEACLKFTCDADWALLYLEAATQRVFAAWHVGGEAGPHLFPADPGGWPAAAMAALRAKPGG